ncbi:MAG: helix-turn-helix domain-containing protein [Ectothiorhodospiraceae bacterium]|nr:helix-turn-helix domain-containing protein [Ectothiorhodospiraceae bacterium]
MVPPQWRPYVPVAKRRARGAREAARRAKRGEALAPVSIEGRAIARTFWGRAWCEHLEGFRDYANRLPRGRTYVRNGSVIHLAIGEGVVEALVMGSELYEVRLAVTTLPEARWLAVKARCEGGIGSLVELLEGRLSERVMAVVTDREAGLFPLPREIRFSCSCPDWATMCKHVAAVCYGVGARLDERPELLFRLRGVDHEALIAADASALLAAEAPAGGRRRIAEDDLAAVFGIDLAGADVIAGAPPPTRAKRASASTASPDTKGRRRQCEPGATARAAKPPRTGARKVRARDAGRAPAADRSPDAVAPVAERGTRTADPTGFTGAAVKRMRARLELTRAELARLLGVSVTTISNWESTRGRLGLQRRTFDALRAAHGLSPSQARRRLRRT